MIRGEGLRRALRVAPLGGLVLVCVVSVALGQGDPGRLTPAEAWSAPGAHRWLGSGEAGVDLGAVVAHATLRAVGLAIVVAAFGLVVGAPLGAAAAISRGRVERVIGRACDLVQAFPTFLLAMAVLSAVRSPGRIHLALVFLLTAWAPFARLALSETRVLRSAAFVEAAYALGRTRAAVVWRHVLPNLAGTMAVQLGSSASAVVVSEAALAFVGLGPRDGVSLGAVLDQGVAAMLRAPHVLFVGSVAVFVTSGALLLAGRAAEGRSHGR